MNLKKQNKLIIGMALTAGLLTILPAITYAGTPSISSVKISGPNMVTAVYSEAVTTNLKDYSNFTGALSGRNLVSLDGNGSSIINLTFDGGNLGPDVSGGLDIATTTLSVSDNSHFSGGTFSATDGQAPVISSVTITANNARNAFGKIGDAITLTFNVNESVMNPTANIMGHIVSVSGNGSGPYTAVYNIASGDTEGNISAVISFSDLAGNTSKATLTFANGAAGAASLASLTSNATSYGALKIGDTIIFTLTPASQQPNATVSGSYNGVPLYWATLNGGITYTATYAVTSGQSDQATPVQISGVTLTNSTGAASAPISGLDIVKLIDAHAPVISEIVAVPAQTNITAPNYAFSSSEYGAVHYGGDCSSQTASVSSGINNIFFNNLANGLHSNCVITVSDAAGNVSNQITVSPFTVASAAPTTPPVAAASFKFTKALSAGSTGNEVIELQKRLAAEGVYSGPINGRFGPLTKTAVKKYQAKRGLTQLGNVGPATRAALNQ